MSRRKIAFVAIGILIVAGVVVQTVWRPFAHRKAAPGGALVLDIQHPDAIVDSEALSRLPRDILRVPLLKDVLTQDFVDYYESDSTRLSAEGALRRLAFEHQLDWRDELMRRVFDEPAHVLLWRSPDGRLGYWLMSIHRNGLAKLLQGLGNLATSDAQLSQVATLSGNVPVYALKLAVGRTLLFAAKDERLVVMSAPGVLLDEKGAVLGERGDAVSAMLASGRDDALRAYRLDAAEGANLANDSPKGHRVVVSANYLSFGYQAFFSGIDAFRFDFAPNGNAASSWQTAALIDPAKLPQEWNSADLWHVLPASPAACTSVPADWKAASALLAKVAGGGADNAAAIGDRLVGPAAVCWYAKSTLVAPVFVARLKSRDAQSVAALKTALGQTFGDVIGAYEAKAATADKGADKDAASGDTAGYRRLPVTTKEQGADITVWQRPVSATSGTASAGNAPFAAQLSAPRYFPVTLALAHGYLIFSPDARLVDDTLAVLAKRYPALADTLAPQRLPRTVLTLTPSSAAQLIEREAGAALPPDQEAVFRNASRTHLVPKLRALAKYPPVSLSLPQTLPVSVGWVPVTWWFDRASAGTGASGDASASANAADADSASAGSLNGTPADQPGTEGD